MDVLAIVGFVILCLLVAIGITHVIIWLNDEHTLS